MRSSFHSFYLQLPVLSHHLFGPYHLVALPYLGTVTKAIPLTPSSYKMAVERIAWGLVGNQINPLNI